MSAVPETVESMLETEWKQFSTKDDPVVCATHGSSLLQGPCHDH